VSDLVRFGDTVILREPFLDEARANFPDDPVTAVLWDCGRCGASFRLADVRIDDGLKPYCPEDGCDASGWDVIGPAMHLYD
jgi:hypothetical protein